MHDEHLTGDSFENFSDSFEILFLLYYDSSILITSLFDYASCHVFEAVISL